MLKCRHCLLSFTLIKAGTVFTNWDYNAQVTYSGNSDMYDYWHNWNRFANVDKNEKIEVGDAVAMKWTQTGQGDDGRSNYVAVEYTDKDGNLQTKRYNFVRKNSNYGDDLDIENGMFYLAEVEKGEDGKWHYTRITDNENNYDDYNKLLAAVAAANAAAEDIEKYNAAKKAVDEATAKVEQIKADLDKLNNVSVNSAVIKALKDKLDKANEDLEVAKEAKDALEEKVAEARAAVEAIDLSRFNVSAVTADDTEENTDTEDTDEDAVEAADEAGDTSAPAAVITPAAVTVSVPGLGIAPIVLPAAPAAVAQAGALESTPAGGVLGARVAEDLEERVFGGKLEEEGAEDDFVIAPNTDLIEEVFGMDDEETGKKLVKIEDNVVPLAAMPKEDNAKMSWWWLLIILLLGATGKKMYDEHQKKVAAREEADR